MMKQQVTVQGDFWDCVALRAYRAEYGQFLMHKVLEANFWARKIAQFSGGLSVAIPPIQPVIEVSLVPWKKASVSVEPLPPGRSPVYLGQFDTVEQLPPVTPSQARPGDFAYVRAGASITRGAFARYGSAIVQAKGEGEYE